MVETNHPGNILFLTIQMLSLKVIDLSSRLKKDEDNLHDETVDRHWTRTMIKYFKELYKSEQKAKTPHQQYHKAIIPLIKYFRKEPGSSRFSAEGFVSDLRKSEQNPQIIQLAN